LTLTFYEALRKLEINQVELFD